MSAKSQSFRDISRITSLTGMVTDIPESQTSWVISRIPRPTGMIPSLPSPGHPGSFPGWLVWWEIQVLWVPDFPSITRLTDKVMDPKSSESQTSSGSSLVFPGVVRVSKSVHPGCSPGLPGRLVWWEISSCLSPRHPGIHRPTGMVKIPSLLSPGSSGDYQAHWWDDRSQVLHVPDFLGGERSQICWVPDILDHPQDSQADWYGKRSQVCRVQLSPGFPGPLVWWEIPSLTNPRHPGSSPGSLGWLVWWEIPSLPSPRHPGSSPGFLGPLVLWEISSLPSPKNPGSSPGSLGWLVW